MKKKLLYVISTALALFASVFVLTACLVWAHQPEVPEELLQPRGGRA